MTRARELALKIWHAGVNRVRAERLIADNVQCKTDLLSLCSTEIDLTQIGRICVVGAGKAAGYLAKELSNVLRPVASSKQLHGLVNVPADCVLDDPFIRQHAARPAGVNEPRAEGVAGTQEMLRLVTALQPNDLCICLITGGGSALLPAPVATITLDDKLKVTRLLSARGASIQEINCVRIALSDVKGGGLANRCGANQLVTLIVSDIIGDPLDLIASGPTLTAQQPRVAPHKVLASYVKSNELSETVWNAVSNWEPSVSRKASARSHHLLANNHTAATAAAEHAQSLGLDTIILEPESPQTTAEEVAKQLVSRLSDESENTSPRCVIWGGEPVVKLSSSPGKGGRNQQLVLATLQQWNRVSAKNQSRLCILSGGTDGEDGPTDAAGAFVDAEVVESAHKSKLDPSEYLAQNNAYPFFEKLNALLKTGPTHTNVCDLRVAVLT